MSDFLGNPISIGDFIVTPKRSSRNEVDLQVGIVIGGSGDQVLIATSKTARAQKPSSAITKCSSFDVPKELRKELSSIAKMVK